MIATVRPLVAGVRTEHSSTTWVGSEGIMPCCDFTLARFLSTWSLPQRSDSGDTTALLMWTLSVAGARFSILPRLLRAGAPAKTCAGRSLPGPQSRPWSTRPPAAAGAARERRPCASQTACCPPCWQAPPGAGHWEGTARAPCGTDDDTGRVLIGSRPRMSRRTPDVAR